MQKSLLKSIFECHLSSTRFMLCSLIIHELIQNANRHNENYMIYVYC
jgi:two-component sensor histidine kinase